MKQLLSVFVAVLCLVPFVGHAQERATQGINVCREENPADLEARNSCYNDWRRAAILVRRYHETYVQSGETFFDGFIEGMKMSVLINPYKLNRRRLFGNCSAGQLFNGNMWNDTMDFRSVWSCIAEHDTEAAKWDMI